MQKEYKAKKKGRKMRKAKYYDTEPSKFATITEGTNIFRMNRRLLLKLAKEHGALITVCDRVKRIDVEKLSEALIENTIGGQQ